MHRTASPFQSELPNASDGDQSKESEAIHCAAHFRPVLDSLDLFVSSENGNRTDFWC